jgi:CHAT domain-containing protein
MTENPLLRSGLALAGFNPRSSGGEDGVLTALEASQLNLFGTQLVVLSACETGLGDIANGEGVYGLRRAFAIAGAETQLMSLWQVDDFGTQSLMARYYENLTAGMGRSEALRQVQLEMIRADDTYSHPYYWAAFILAGDWRSLD